MVAACALACPGADVHEGDLRDLSRYPLAAYDAIWAGYNIVDILDDAERGAFLASLRERLAPGGRLVFSSHNLAAVRSRRGPLALVTGGARQRAYALLRLPRRARNHRQTAPFEYRAEAHAVRADEENDFAGLHYYVGRDEQERQLGARGFALEECRDLEGALVEPGARAAASPELHYVARPASTL
jgi:SAM-dependent methyltransferase